MNTSSQTPSPSTRSDLINVFRGFAMGTADTVPGVSGGTVALIMGHYSRLVGAISRVDTRLLYLLRQRQWKDALEYVDARFLFALGFGIACGIVLLANAMHFLLDAFLPETFSVFLGLLVASLWVVVKSIEGWNASRGLTLILCAGLAVAISSLPTTTGEPSLLYLFIAASVAICAMILPGISGAFVLLVFGVYHPITGIIKDFAKLNFSADGFSQLFVVALGCGFGLLAFSRLLRFLLERHPSTTLAGLTGLMLGSVVKLWPLQVATPETASLKPKFRIMQYQSPAEWEGTHLWILVSLAVVAAIAVIAAETWSSRINDRANLRLENESLSSSINTSQTSEVG
ncbi:MAG: DUF368 domain-containing protein [Rubripirellula sp.]|nr:DUF368 domain-containing protein [Rubripirellula sp.]